MTPAESFGREHSDAITDAVRALSGEQRSLVGTAFAIGASSGYRWRDRYGAADRAMLALGAVRSPKGRRRQNSIYRMPCGCVYHLHFAQPMCIVRCAAHPLTPLTVAEISRDALGCLGGWLQIGMGAIVVTAVLLAVVTVLGLLTGQTDATFLRVAIWYWTVAGVILLGWRVLGTHRHRHDS